MKNTYYIKYFVTPTERNINKEILVDSVVCCWVVAERPIDAHIKATFFIEKYDWEIIENRLEPTSVTRKQFENNEIKLNCFDMAQKENISFVFFGGNNPEEIGDKKRTIVLKESYNFDINEIIKISKELKNKGRCLHYESIERCNQQIINAHSIQKKGLLSKIAQDGHVYVYNPDYWALEKNKGEITIKKEGINKVSIFMGFCKTHDNELFEPIDNFPMIPTDEQVFLYAYRSICKEMFVKENSLMQVKFLLKKFKDHKGLSNFWEGFRKGTVFGLSNLERHKKIYDRCLTEKKFGEIRYIIFNFKNPPTLVFSNLICPDYDLLGRKLQDLGNHSKILDLITICSVKTKEGWGFLLAWHESSSTVCEEYISSLIKVTHKRNDVEDYLFRLALAGENIAIAPKWWEGLDVEVKEQILKKFTDYCDIFKVVDSSYLLEGLNGVSGWKFDVVNTNI